MTDEIGSTSTEFASFAFTSTVKARGQWGYSDTLSLLYQDRTMTMSPGETMRTAYRAAHTDGPYWNLNNPRLAPWRRSSGAAVRQRDLRRLDAEVGIIFSVDF